MKTRIWLPLAIAASLLGTAPADAQEAAKSYPSRPIRLIVPNAPGSAVDTLSRIVGTELAQHDRPAGRDGQPRRRGRHHRHGNRQGSEP